MVIFQVVQELVVLVQAAGAEAVRLEVYQTGPGSNPEACQPEKQLLMSGIIHAIAFTLTAEVGVCPPLFKCTLKGFAT